jgi:hypothetical protein
MVREDGRSRSRVPNSGLKIDVPKARMSPKLLRIWLVKQEEEVEAEDIIEVSKSMSRNLLRIWMVKEEGSS